jgi:hypothetical protein
MMAPYSDSVELLKEVANEGWEEWNTFPATALEESESWETFFAYSSVSLLTSEGWESA